MPELGRSETEGCWQLEAQQNEEPRLSLAVKVLPALHVKAAVVPTTAATVIRCNEERFLWAL
jgi:hypothetical protein